MLSRQSVANREWLADMRRLNDYDNKGEPQLCTPGITEEDCRECGARSEDHPEGSREVCLWQH